MATLLIIASPRDQPSDPGGDLEPFASTISGAEPPRFGRVKIAIFRSGYALEMKDLLTTFGEAAEFIRPEEFSPSTAAEYQIVIIPSAALASLENLSNLRKKFSEYVSSGGTLLVMAQPMDTCYRLLPDEVEGIGYYRDKARYAAAGIDRYNPALAGQTDATVDGTADGVLTAWPERAEIWLHRLKNDFPALLMYRHGAGRVIVSNYYSDYAHGHSQLYKDERALLRDLLSWARDFAEIPEVKPGGKLRVDVPVAYPAGYGRNTPAARVRLVLRNPDRRKVSIKDHAVKIPPGGSARIPFTFDDTGRVLSGRNGLGIWWINYEFYDAQGRLLQSELEGQRVALSLHLQGAGRPGGRSITPAREVVEVDGCALEAAASLDKRAYLAGETAHLTLRVRNAGGQPGVPLAVRVKHGDFDETREIVLEEEAALTFALPAEPFGEKIFYGFYHAGTGRSLLMDVININQAFPEFTVTTEKDRYRAGETVYVKIETASAGWLAIAGPGDFYRFEEVKDGATYAIPLPASLPAGTYGIWVGFGSSTMEHGRTVEHRIDVLGADVRFVSGTLEETRLKNGDPFRLDLLLTSREELAGRIVLELVKPDGGVLPLASREIALAAGENRLSFAGELRTELAGVHAFRVKILDGETVVARQDFAFLCGEVELVAVETDPSEYLRGDETIRGLVHLYGRGSGEVEILLDGRPVAVLPASVSGATVLPFVLEGVVPAPGTHTLKAVYRGAEGSSGQVGTSFVYGAGLPDLRVAALEVGKERTAEGALPVTVAVEKANPLPAEGVRVRVYQGEALIGEYTIERLEEEGALHRQTIFWETGEFHGRAVITAEVTLTGGAKEFDTANNTTATEVEIPQAPVVTGLPAVTKEAAFPISGRTSPKALVLLYQEDDLLDFALADGDGLFTLNEFHLSEGMNRLWLNVRGERGWESRKTETFTVFVDSVPPEIWPLNIAQGHYYNYDLVPEVAIEEENLEEAVYTINGLAWVPGTPIVSEGDYHFLVRARDRAGNEAEFSLSFTIDKTPPAITMENVSDGAYYAEPIEPEIVIAEEHPEGVAVTLNGELYLGGEITEDGTYELSVFALDQAGNSDYYRVAFTLDRTPPRIEVEGVSDGGVYAGPVIPAIRILEANPDRIEILLDGAAYEPGMPIQADGLHHLSITAVDLAGNLSAVELAFTIEECECNER